MNTAINDDVLGGFARGESLEQLWDRLRDRYELARLPADIQLLFRGVFLAGIETALRTMTRAGRDRTEEFINEVEIAVDTLGLVTRNIGDGGKPEENPQ